MNNLANSFLEALKQFPNEDKKGYLACLERRPQLLHSESCMDRFLRRHSGGSGHHQVKDAARRFLGYWDMRYSVYNTTAFEPLTVIMMTEEPTASSSPSRVMSLTDACLAMLRSGWICSLPMDSSDRRVCFIHATDQVGHHVVSEKEMYRCMFYMLQCLSEDSATQTKGVSFILTHASCPSKASLKVIKILEALLQVVPIRVARLHIVSEDNQDQIYSFAEEYLPVALKILMETSAGNEDLDSEEMKKRIQVHFNLPQERLLSIMTQTGFRPENLPHQMGGSWTSRHCEAWMRERQVHEQCLALLPPSLPNFSFPGSQSEGANQTSMTPRKVDQAYTSKQKRLRKRCRTKAFEMCSIHLEEQKIGLSEVNKELEQALQGALALVATIESGKKRTRPLSDQSSHEHQLLTKRRGVPEALPHAAVTLKDHGLAFPVQPHHAMALARPSSMSPFLYATPTQGMTMFRDSRANSSIRAPDASPAFTYGKVDTIRTSSLHSSHLPIVERVSDLIGISDPILRSSPSRNASHRLMALKGDPLVQHYPSTFPASSDMGKLAQDPLMGPSPEMLMDMALRTREERLIRQAVAARTIRQGIAASMSQQHGVTTTTPILSPPELPLHCLRDTPGEHFSFSLL